MGTAEPKGVLERDGKTFVKQEEEWILGRGPLPGNGVGWG